MDILKFAVLMVVLHLIVSSMIHHDLQPSLVNRVINTQSEGGMPHRYS
ncbi:hypothetical protein DFQ50_103370 [Pseudocitrobacter faecalis]|jgi:hypothetical protein|uniref:Uncharacterized protein n=1 Tax=Pseudocitrobacter faecalis TaxID=1398493 RepID=A0ABX9FZJ8_9ENTR|nr:hypothetical protein DFQ50_103370 [Pseudocitrobacter faecalis]